MFLHIAHGGNRHEHEDQDDRDDDQQLHQREAVGLDGMVGATVRVRAIHGVSVPLRAEGKISARPRKSYNVWTQKGNRTLGNAGTRE